MGKRLLGVERNGDRIDKYWRHDDTKITVQTTQDVEPAFKAAKRAAESHNGKGTFRHKASIPANIIDEVCKVTAAYWGEKPHEVFREMVDNKTDRAQRIWKMLSEARDYNRFHSKTYR